MRALTSVTTVCRIFLGLDRSDASGVLHLQGDGRTAAIAMEDGAVVGANVDRRVASSERQLLESAARACDWEGLRLRLVREPAVTTWWRLREPVAGRSLALRLMQSAALRAERSTLRADLGSGVYHLTESGEALVRGAGLRPEETSVVFWLRRGVSADDLLGLPACGLRGFRFAWVLKLLGGAAPRAGGSYPLLLRKRRELRQRASARTLLDLPEDAGQGDARHALRKLVREIHPDRFGTHAPPALRRASGEIVSALVSAEAAIASKTPS